MLRREFSVLHPGMKDSSHFSSTPASSPTPILPILCLCDSSGKRERNTKSGRRKTETFF